MNSKWTSHLSKDSVKKEEFKGVVMSASPVLSRLIDILTKDIETNRREQKKIDLYDLRGFNKPQFGKNSKWVVRIND